MTTVSPKVPRNPFMAWPTGLPHHTFQADRVAIAPRPCLLAYFQEL